MRIRHSGLFSLRKGPSCQLADKARRLSLGYALGRRGCRGKLWNAPVILAGVEGDSEHVVTVVVPPSRLFVAFCVLNVAKKLPNLLFEHTKPFIVVVQPVCFDFSIGLKQRFPHFFEEVALFHVCHLASLKCWEGLLCFVIVQQCAPSLCAALALSTQACTTTFQTRPLPCAHAPCSASSTQPNYSTRSRSRAAHNPLRASSELQSTRPSHFHIA